MKIDLFATSNVGKVRNNNEDNFFVDGYYRKNYDINNFSYTHIGDTLITKVYAVFDGMGGTQFGEEASGAAAEYLNRYYSAVFEEKMDFNIGMALRKINYGVCKTSRKFATHSGSTIVLSVIKDNKMRIANVGDSRAYLFKNKELNQITVDHNEAAIYKDMQVDIEIPNSKNVLTQHLGIEENDFILEPFISEQLELKKDDIVLLCSDGLCGFVNDEKIAELLRTNDSVQNISEKLMKEALDAGGKDNITILLFRVK